MKRSALFLVILIAAALVLYEMGVYSWCDGSYDLTVEIAPESAVGVSSISYMCASNETGVDKIIADFQDVGPFAELEHQATVEPFTVNLWFSYRVSQLSGRDLGYTQHVSYIVVILHREDGSSLIHRLEIPHRHDSRHLIVDSTSVV